MLLLSGNSEERCVTGDFRAPKLSQLLMRPLHMCVQVTLVAEGSFTYRADMEKLVSINSLLLLLIFMNFTKSDFIIVFNFLISYLDIFLFSTQVSLQLVDNFLRNAVFLLHLVSFPLN